MFVLSCANLGGRPVSTVTDDPAVELADLCLLSEASGLALKRPHIKVYPSSAPGGRGAVFVLAMEWIRFVVGPVDALVPGGLPVIRLRLGGLVHSVVGVYASCVQWGQARVKVPWRLALNSATSWPEWMGAWLMTVFKRMWSGCWGTYKAPWAWPSAREASSFLGTLNG